MAAGDVQVNIVDADATAIDSAITSMRVGANDKWLMTSSADGLQVIIVNIEET